MLMLAMTLLNIQLSHAETFHISCWDTKRFPANYEYNMTNVMIHLPTAPNSPAHFIFKFKSKQNGRPFTLRGEGFFKEDPSGNSQFAQIEISQPPFNHVELTFEQGTSMGVFGTLWSDKSKDPVGGGLLQCRGY